MCTIDGLINHLKCNIILKKCSIDQMALDNILPTKTQAHLAKCIKQEIEAIHGWIAMLNQKGLSK